MPHVRQRFASPLLRKLGGLWPVVGLLGPRQSGKTTIVQQLLGIGEVVSFDDLETREEASRSPKTFLARLPIPTVIDEVQKAPPIFDAIKLRVDRKRIPGSYFLTGSSAFSSRLDIRESLTGRIGLVELSPLTLAEIKQEPFRPIETMTSPLPPRSAPRFNSEEIAQHIVAGGMPIPAFLRDASQREFYWRSWLETTLTRDLARFFKRGYDPDIAFNLLTRMGAILRDGELPTLNHFPQPARTLRTYLSAMQDIFLLRRISCHPLGTGKEVWLMMDSGLAAYLIGNPLGEGGMLSLVRHFMWNEWLTQSEYQGKRLERTYYKSARGSPVDIVMNGVPFRIVASPMGVTKQRGIEERPLLGAMKTLKSKVGYLVAPVNEAVAPPKNGGIGVLPWGSWS